MTPTFHTALWPLNPQGLFEARQESENTILYTLKTSQLSEDFCHMFFPLGPVEEWSIAETLEHSTFHPLRKIHEKFNIEPIKVGDIRLMWCRFPKEYRDVCVRVAQLFNLTTMEGNRAYASASSRLWIPSNPKLLNFNGPRCHDWNVIREQISDMKWLGDRLEKDGID
jgi:hypothetical protein